MIDLKFTGKIFLIFSMLLSIDANSNGRLNIKPEFQEIINYKNQENFKGFHRILSIKRNNISGTPRNTFKIVTNATAIDVSLITNAIEKADFGPYRLKSNRRQLYFDNGIVVELLSAIEVKNLGYDIDESFYPESLSKDYKEPVFSISNNGEVIQNHQSNTSVKGYNKK